MPTSAIKVARRYTSFIHSAMSWLRIQSFWQAKHSQIYPLLSKMEAEGYVEHELVLQTDKPDKKVYSITPSGLEALKNWLPEPTTEVATRDELLIKMYAIWLSDAATAKQLMEERIESQAIATLGGFA